MSFTIYTTNAFLLPLALYEVDDSHSAIWCIFCTHHLELHTLQSVQPYISGETIWINTSV